MKAFSLLLGLGLTNAVDLPQDVIGQHSCDRDGQDTLYRGMCECEEGCCTSGPPAEDGCPVDIVLAIDMCSCNNHTWNEMKEFTRNAVDALHAQFDISDQENSGRMAIFQFMEETHDVVGLDTFTKKEILRKVNNMENSKFHGRGTDLTKAVKHAQKILEGSSRSGVQGIRKIFAVITNGYSDQKLTTDNAVFEAHSQLRLKDDVTSVFIAREDSSVSGARGSRTNDEVRDIFEKTLKLKDPVAPQQLIGNIECDPLPEPDYHKDCNCKCDVPMGCQGIKGEPGVFGAEGPMGKDGSSAKEGKDGPAGENGPMGDKGDMGGCGMPGVEGQKGAPGEDAEDGVNGTDGPKGVVGPEGFPGITGERGEQGDAGTAGDKGKTGVQGSPGNTGRQGDEGVRGELDPQTLKWLVNKIFIEELEQMKIQHAKSS